MTIISFAQKLNLKNATPQGSTKKPTLLSCNYAKNMDDVKDSMLEGPKDMKDTCMDVNEVSKRDINTSKIVTKGLYNKNIIHNHNNGLWMIFLFVALVTNDGILYI